MNQSAVIIKSRTKRWATKTKTGCSVCRQRRIKCDEGRPSCFKCKSAHYVCTGYNYSPASDRHRNNRLLLPKAIPTTPKTEMDSLCDAIDIMHLSPIAQLGAVSKEGFDQLIEMQVSVSHRTRTYFHELPRLVGHEPALDSAIKSVCLIMKSKLQEPAVSKSSQINAFRHYGRTLTAMQQAIWDPVRATSTLTLCAVELLCCFESFCRDIRKPSLEHIYGACQLIEIRGPDAIKSDLDKSLFAAKIPNLYLLGVLHGERHFLEEEPWQQAMRNCIDPSTTSIDRQGAVVELCCVVACCSGVLRDCVDYFTSQERSVRSQAGLLARVNALRERLLNWHAIYGDTVVSYTLSDGSRKLRVEFGEDIKLGDMVELLAMYHTFVASISRTLIALGDDNGMELERQSYRYMAWMLNGLDDDLDERCVLPDSLVVSPHRSYNLLTATSQAPMVKAAQLVAFAFVHTSAMWMEAMENVHKIGAIVGSSSRELEALCQSWLRIAGFGVLRQV